MAWYVIHTFTGHENKVKASIERRAAAQGIGHKMHRILVLTEEEVTGTRGGKKQVRKHKVYPGYVFIEMDLDDETRFLIRNTPGVTGFVGPDKQPVPLKDSEIRTILDQVEGVEIPVKAIWQAGNVVRVTSGPFANFEGTIEEVNVPKEQVRVLISLFGRDTPVTLGFNDIEKI
ncbi:MAG: transcription termination/antitermination protein NusG [Armatimonadota bacterium]